jgi:hypothetical protein
MSPRITTCYQCDADSVNREHVPPQCLFPDGGEWNKLITVPSCAEHNNKASQADEYLKFMLAAGAENAPKPILEGAVRGLVRLVERESPSLARYGSEREGNTVTVLPDFPLDFELLSSCLDKIARGLYFHHHGKRIKLRTPLEVHPIFIPLSPDGDLHFRSMVRRIRAATATYFASQPKLGGHPEVFAYQIIEDDHVVVVNMEFYAQHWVAVMGLKSPAPESVRPEHDPATSP